MNLRRSSAPVRTAAGLVATLLAASPALARSAAVHDRAARLPIAGGSLHVALRPDDGRTLDLVSEGPHRWAFPGDTRELVGEPYSIVLRNDSPERLKVVVGVDGLNVYEREVVAGSAGEDVGSILPPWSTRVLPGWQVGNHRAQRFVFSPNEWSEGQGRTESSIGQVTVQAYREWRHPDWGERDGEWKQRGEAGSPRPGVTAPPSEPAPSTAESSRDSAPRAARPREPIGTTAGEDVSHSVRTVRFDAATDFPEAWAVIDYGRGGRGREWPEPELLGLGLAPDRDGARIVSVAPGSPAERAGLAPSDVIVRLDSVYSPSPYTARRILRGKDRGDYAFLRVRRGPHELSVKIRG
jgi:hypothetical protein